jgi:hypothetical protein
MVAVRRANDEIAVGQCWRYHRFRFDGCDLARPGGGLSVVDVEWEYRDDDTVGVCLEGGLE